MHYAVCYEITKIIWNLPSKPNVVTTQGLWYYDLQIMCEIISCPMHVGYMCSITLHMHIIIPKWLSRLFYAMTT